MRFLKKLAFIIPIVILLTACPYESAVPITDATEVIDSSLLGKWYKEGEKELEYPSEYYDIEDLGGKLYEITKFDLNSEDSTYRTETYISHFSDLEKAGEVYRFLNMKKDGKYYLHKIDLVDDQFVLFEVTDNIDDKFSDSDELRSFVSDNMHLSFFYNKDEVTFYRGDHTK